MAGTNDGTGTGTVDTTTNNMNHIMHMTFFWGKNAEVLFSGWPGSDNPGMYILSLAVVFFLAVLVEWLTHSNYVSEESSNHVSAGLIQTAVYGVRICLAYMVMLAVMSFNGGVFVAAVAGHSLGFLVFGSRVFKKPSLMAYVKTTDLQQTSCNC